MWKFPSLKVVCSPCRLIAQRFWQSFGVELLILVAENCGRGLRAALWLQLWLCFRLKYSCLVCFRLTCFRLIIFPSHISSPDMLSSGMLLADVSASNLLRVMDSRLVCFRPIVFRPNIFVFCSLGD
jgi:hypothetical protein